MTWAPSLTRAHGLAACRLLFIRTPPPAFPRRFVSVSSFKFQVWVCDQGVTAVVVVTAVCSHLIVGVTPNSQQHLALVRSRIDRHLACLHIDPHLPTLASQRVIATLSRSPAARFRFRLELERFNCCTSCARACTSTSTYTSGVFCVLCSICMVCVLLLQCCGTRWLCRYEYSYDV